MHSSGAHSRCNLGSTQARASRRNTFGAQKRLGMVEKHARNGCTVPSHKPPTLDNRSCHRVGLRVGCGGRALWSVSMPLLSPLSSLSFRSERRGPFFLLSFRSQFLFIPKHQYFPMSRGTYYTVYYLIYKTLWYEILVTMGTSLYCINERKRF